jgi:hypothetical protein
MPDQDPKVREMTEEEASEEGLFDCPTCGHLRDVGDMTPEAADEWAASRGVKIVRAG